MCSRLTATHPLQSAAPIGRTVYWPPHFTCATSLSTSSKTLSFLAPSAACIAIRTISRFRRYVLCITSADSSTRSSISRLIRKASPPTFDTSNISDTKSESSIPSNSDPSNLRKPDPRYTDCQSETHAFGVDDANKTNSRIDHVPNPVPESGYFTQAPTGHSSLAPKGLASLSFSVVRCTGSSRWRRLRLVFIGNFVENRRTFERQMKMFTMRFILTIAVFLP